MDHYAVFGNPISQSKSPWIHGEFARQTKQALEYSAQFVEIDAFETDVQAFFAAGGSGLNVTVPFKERAWAMCDILSDIARLTGAVNTLYLSSDGKLCGDNTDGHGLLRDLTNNHAEVLTGKSVLLLGAGGAVKGVLPALLAQKPASVTIANRTVEKAVKIAQTYADKLSIAVYPYAELPKQPYDFVINGTSAGLQGELPPLPEQIVSAHTCCYDMIYGQGETAFQQWAKQRGAAQAIDGLGMLVEQAAQAFKVWRQCEPQTAAVIKQLREQLAQAKPLSSNNDSLCASFRSTYTPAV